jgi:hypothetical protein
VPWFPLLLAVHVTLAISLLLPSLLLPFLLRQSGPDITRPQGVTRVLLAMQGTGSLIIAIGLALSGTGLLVLLGAQLLTRPWLIVALLIYAANLAVAAFVARPNLRRLVGIRAEGDTEAWKRRARRQRLVAYAMAGATGLIGLLMSTKPELW